MSTPPPPPDAVLAERIVARLRDAGLIAAPDVRTVREAVASGQSTRGDWSAWIGSADFPSAPVSPADPQDG